MKYIREHKKLSIIILIILVIFLIISLTLGRYILNILNNFILETKSFYFNSSILTINNKGYSINNWDGVNAYTLTIDLNNRKNAKRITKADISYDINVTCSDNVSCTLSKTSSVIYSTDESDSYQITVTPVKNFYEGDTATVSTSVTSNSPYTKTLSATYSIGIKKSKFSYNIEDSTNAKYLTLNLTNSITYYEVQTAFSNYSIGDQISIDDYANLSDSEKANCFSAIVTVEFDPKVLFCDLTNNLYINRLSNNYEEETIDGYKYVKKFSFKMNASSNRNIIFYKDDITKNYTYPIVNDNSIVNVSVTTAK